ncbi:MAG TPA: NAD(P)-dependent oxidoreductase [Salinivirgaceae bacterium]|nr:NAD(P)-dependent oxidoreductase [Salinivirgaceae bacterium]
MKVLFVDTTHPLLRQLLEQAGFECEYFPFTKKEEYLPIIANYDGIIIRSKFYIDADFLGQAKRLKFIGRVGSGLENIDLEAAKKLRIQCINSPEGNRDAVGEHALSMLLSLFNNISRANQQIRNGIWLREDNRGIELKGKCVGIIGFGNTGSAFAEKLLGFGCRILAYDKYKSYYAPFYVSETDLATIQSTCDVISFHVPYNSETHYMVNEQFLHNCRQGVYIINTSRGKVINTRHLLNAINSGKVAGACLDVFEFESVSFETVLQTDDTFRELLKSEKVILTPHIAGWTYESNLRLSEVLARKIIQLFSDTTN